MPLLWNPDEKDDNARREAHEPELYFVLMTLVMIGVVVLVQVVKGFAQ